MILAPQYKTSGGRTAYSLQGQSLWAAKVEAAVGMSDAVTAEFILAGNSGVMHTPRPNAYGTLVLCAFLSLYQMSCLQAYWDTTFDTMRKA
jgi:hypothetical protein